MPRNNHNEKDVQFIKGDTMRMSLLSEFMTLLCVLSLFSFADATEKNITGTWRGTLSVRGMELRIVFHIQLDTTGVLRGTMDSPDQGAKGIIVDEVRLRRDSVGLVVKIAAAGYDGVIQPGDSVIAGSWHQGGLSFPLDLHHAEQATEALRPQEPKPPFPYDTEEVTYENKAAGVTLAGTLSKPKSPSPCPALLLITGSGAQNRDEEIFGHKPFLLLADYLTRRGIAVLRVDDRGVGKSTGVFTTATTKDFAGDVLAGVQYLKSRNDVDGRKIGLLGHSEGGLIAPMVANESKDVAFIVLLAGPSLPGDQILCLQDSLISAAMGAPKESINERLRLMRHLHSLVKSESDTIKLRENIRFTIRQFLLADSTRAAANDSATVAAATAQLTSPWFMFFLKYDPAPALAKVSCPILALNGEKDLQVPARENIDGMMRAFKKSGNVKATARILPGLNHLFQKAETGAVIEYGKIDETMNPEALRAIGDWISSVTH